jgi:hypothetical protein
LNSLVQTFQFSCSPEDESRPISVSDPSLLPLPFELEPRDLLETNGHRLQISSLHFQNVDDGTTSRHDASVNMKLVKMFAQQTDLSIVEALYLLPMADYQQSDIGFEETRQAFSLKKLKKSRDACGTDGDFIVDDLDESTANLCLGQYWKVRNAKLLTSSQQGLGLEDRWTFNFNSVYSTITPQTGLADGATGHEGRDFDTCIEGIKLALQESETLSTGASLSLLVIIPYLY